MYQKNGIGALDGLGALGYVLFGIMAVGGGATYLLLRKKGESPAVGVAKGVGGAVATLVVLRAMAKASATKQYEEDRLRTCAEVERLKDLSYRYRECTGTLADACRAQRDKNFLWKQKVCAGTTSSGSPTAVPQAAGW